MGCRRDHQGQVDVWARRCGHGLVDDRDDLVLVQVDLDGSELACDEGADQALPMSSATTPEARSAAAAGSRPRARPSR